ncbi:hypothetical protein [Gilvimarinus gilvus]|nr:hypothetical protein [Gilvimarinus sp. SDUM040013]
MARQTELKHFPELRHLPIEEQRERLSQAKAAAFGPDQKLTRWRGNLLQFAVMFGMSVLFMMVIAPALALSQDASALVMLLVVLPVFFVLQQRRYLALIRKSLHEQHADSDLPKQ